MNIGFLIDPIDQLNPEKDTSLALMRAAKHLQHTLFFFTPSDIRVHNNSPIIHFSVAEPNSNNSFHASKKYTGPAEDMDIIFIRTDPPVNHNYIVISWILDLVSKKTLLINPPNSLRNFNEKLATLYHPKHIAPTSVIWSKEDALDLLSEHKTIIAKPIDGHGGKGIFKIKKNDPNAGVIFETLTENNTTPIIIQPYIKEAKQGDKRIILCNGKVIGCVLRKQSGTDHRNNFFAGGHAEHYELTQKDLDIVDSITPFLLHHNLHLVGLDLLGHTLTEINITSPTGIVEMSELNNQDLAPKIISEIIKLKEAQTKETTNPFTKPTKKHTILSKKEKK